MNNRKYNASKEHATPQTMAAVVDYLVRLQRAGNMRALAVAYVDPDGKDYQLLAVQHLDQQGAAGVGIGLTKLGQILAADAV